MNGHLPAEIAFFVEWARQQLALEHAPSSSELALAAMSVLAILMGTALAVWGAQMVRGGILLAGAASGAWLGWTLSHNTQFPLWLGTLLGLGVGGLAAVWLFRLWVGVGWATLLVGALLAIGGYRTAWPHWKEFIAPEVLQDASGDYVFRVPDAGEQAAAGNPDPRAVFARFGEYLMQKEPTLRRNALLLCIPAALVGLLMGIFAAKATTIIATSCVGVGMLLGGVLYLASLTGLSAFSGTQEHPMVLVGIFALGVLVAVCVQYAQGARRRPAPAVAPEPVTTA